MAVSILPNGRERDAATNLAAMVGRARHESAAFGLDLSFNSPVWELPSDLRPSASHQVVRLYFTTHEGGTSKDIAGRKPLAEPFASFLKAVVRLRHEAKPKTAQNHSVLVRAGRYLYDALEAEGYEPTMLLPRHFDAAARASTSREAPSSRYRVGLFLEELAGWVNRHGVAKVRIDFSNPFPRTGHGDTRFGKEADDRRARLMPSDEALDALARISNLVTEAADVVRMRCVELLVCGGWRINELLTVPHDCEVWDPVFLNGEPVIGPDGEQLRRYGIRYIAEKGGSAGIKWIPTAMVDVARRAVSDIRRETSRARAVAEWNALNPGRTWLPDGWRGLPLGRLLGTTEVEEVTATVNGFNFLNTRGLGDLVDGRVVTTIGQFEAALAAQMPQIQLAGKIVPLHEFLFVMPLNWSHRQRGVISAVVGLVQDQQIYDLTVGRPGVANIFERMGVTGPDGKPFEIRSHQFRHWLNTLAQQGGMSQMEIARWSGRKDVGQNGAYDHTSAVAMAARARELLLDGKVLGAVAQVHERLPLARREAFREAQFATAHTTDLGMCVNDWSLTPCIEHGSCAACSQHLVVKGNLEQRVRAEQLLEEHEFLLAAAEAEVADDTYGASNFVAHNARMRDAMKAVLATHADACIADGTLVQIDLAGGQAAPAGSDRDAG
jgi:hypothetical protein